MSSAIDRRIVEMQFDNKDFETNIQTSVSSLDKLKKSLKLEESAKGLDALEKSGRKFSLDGMVQAAEAVTSKFSILGTIGDQALRRITDAAMNAISKMKELVESLTLQPIKTGFEEYETQINAIQTILSNTREELTRKGFGDAARLDLVNAKLDQLNHYADKTIYNFTEMTRNIGTFTAAGVELEVAVNSIQGIANLAAISGSTSEQASRAMYQLSQAISSGTVRLMDWNSVVNAGMGGKIFQDALVRTATAMGITIDKTVTEVDAAGKKVTKSVKKTVKELIEESGSFRESLSSGWLSSDVLTATLEQFSWDFEQIAENTFLDDAQRETLIQKLADMYIGQGDDADKALERAKKMVGEMTNLSADAVKEIKKAELLASGYTLAEAEEIIKLAQDAVEAATKVKTFTQLFDTLKEAAQSGWTQSWEYIIGDFEEAKETLTAISQFIGGIIDKSAEARNKILKEWHDLGGRDMLWNNDAAKGPLGAFWNLAYGIQNIVSMIREEFQKIFPPATSQMLLNFTSKIQQATASFRAWTENSGGMDKLRRIVAGIAAALDMVKTAAGHAWQGFKKLVGISKPVGESMLEFAASIGDWLVKARESIKTSDSWKQMLHSAGLALTSLRSVAVSVFQTVWSWIGKLWGKIQSSGVLSKIQQGVTSFIGKIPSAIEKIKSLAKSVADYVKNSESVKKVAGTLKNIFDSTIKSVSDFAKRFYEALKNFFNKNVSGESTLWGRLKSRFSEFGALFSDIFISVEGAVTSAWGKIKAFLSNLFTTTIPGFLSSLKTKLSSAAEKLKGVDWGTIIKSVLGVVAAVRIWKTLNDIGSFGKRISQGFKTLATALKNISKYGMSITKDGLVINGKGKNSLVNTLLKLAGSIGILVGSVYVLAKMDTASLTKGFALLSGLAAGLLAVSLAFKKIDLDGGSILKLSAAILLLVAPVELLSMMDTAKALKGIVGIGLILAELALFSRMMKSEFSGKQAGFIGMSVAVNLLVFAMKSLAGINDAAMEKSLLGLGALLLEMGLFTRLASGSKVSGIISLALGMNLMVLAIKSIGSLDTANIAKGVLGLSAVMLAFGGMMKLAGGTNFLSSIGLLVAMAGSLIVFVNAFKQIDTSSSDGMLKFSASFAAMVVSLSASLKVLSTIPIVGALKTVATLAILIAGISAIVVGLGELQKQWSGMSDLLETGGDVLGELGRAIGKFVGGIGGGALEGLAGGLTRYAETLKGISGKVSTEDQNAVISIATSLAGLTEIVKPNSLGDWILALVGRKTSFQQFAEAIPVFGQAMQAYSKFASKFDEELTEEKNGIIISIAKSIASIAENAPEAGLLSRIFGMKTDFEKFTEAITPFGQAMQAYSEFASKFDEELTEEKNGIIISVAKSIASVAENAPTIDILTRIFGMKTDFEKFTEAIPSFGEAMRTYAKEVAGIGTMLKPADTETALNAVDGIRQFAEKLDPSGTVWDALNKAFGEGSKINTLLEYSTTLSTLGTDIKSFADSMKNVNIDGLDMATKVLGAFQNFVSGLENSGSIIQTIGEWINGNQFNTLIITASKMVEFGSYFQSFASSITGARDAAANFIFAKAIFASFCSIVDEINSVGTIDTAKLNEMLYFFSDFGYTMQDFSSSMKNVDLTSLGEAIVAIYAIIAAVKSIQAMPEISIEPIQILLNNFSSITIPEFDAVGAQSAEAYVKSLIKGLISAFGSVSSSAINLAKVGIDGAGATYSGYYNAGRRLGDGIAAGIYSMAGSVRSAAVSVASGAIRSICITWSIHSPSKVGRDLGKNFDQGIALGLSSYSKLVTGTVDGMGEDVVKSASTLLSGVDGSIFDNIDPNPTIRPVMDLTSIQNGVNAMNGMLNTRPTYSPVLFQGCRLSRGINALNMDGAKIAGGLSDKNIVDRLDALQNRIGELGEAVTNMKLVLDSGELVGATSAKMDNALGTAAMHKGRGN